MHWDEQESERELNDFIYIYCGYGCDRGLWMLLYFQLYYEKKRLIVIKLDSMENWDHFNLFCCRSSKWIINSFFPHAHTYSDREINRWRKTEKQIQKTDLIANQFHFISQSSMAAVIKIRKKNWPSNNGNGKSSTKWNWIKMINW